MRRKLRLLPVNLATRVQRLELSEVASAVFL